MLIFGRRVFRKLCKGPGLVQARIRRPVNCSVSTNYFAKTKSVIRNLKVPVWLSKLCQGRPNQFFCLMREKNVHD